MRKNFVLIGVTATFLLLLSAIFVGSYRVDIAEAIGSILRSGANVSTGSLKMRTSDATTTPEFIVAGISTSTLTFASENLSEALLELQVFASSTATNSKVQIERLASDDNINFYPYQVASSTNLLSFDPLPRGATTTGYIDLALFPARYTRINIGIATTTAGTLANKDRMNIWANVVGEIK